MPPIANPGSELTEFQTRKQKIDVLLREQGWHVGDRSKVILEVDTKQSNFRAQNYKTVSETLSNDLDSKYADYLLLDSMGGPIAVVEAKRTSKDPILGQKQAEEYADDIKAQMGKDIFIFLSNGYEIWFWDRERYGPRQVKGFIFQRDLERLRFQVEMGLSLNNFEVNSGIVDRPKSIEITKRVIEHIQRGNLSTARATYRTSSNGSRSGVKRTPRTGKENASSFPTVRSKRTATTYLSRNTKRSNMKRCNTRSRK